MSVMHGQCDTRPTVTFPAARHHRPLGGTKLYCLVTEASVKNLPRVALDSGVAGLRNHDLLIASPAPHRYATESHTHIITRASGKSQIRGIHSREFSHCCEFVRLQ